MFFCIIKLKSSSCFRLEASGFVDVDSALRCGGGRGGGIVPLNDSCPPEPFGGGGGGGLLSVLPITCLCGGGRGRSVG